MSGRTKGTGKISKFLDLCLTKSKLSFWIPIAVAVLIYVLFLIFGQNPDKDKLIVHAPVYGIAWCAGLFLVLWIQLINPLCSPKVMDFGELVFAVMMSWSAVYSVLSFLFDIPNGFSDFSIAAILSLSVLSFIHSLRK